ncbi:unnamed protein product, partial [Pylaiella littoralis]
TVGAGEEKETYTASASEGTASRRGGGRGRGRGAAEEARPASSFPLTPMSAATPQAPWPPASAGRSESAYPSTRLASESPASAEMKEDAAVGGGAPGRGADGRGH